MSKRKPRAYEILFHKVELSRCKNCDNEFIFPFTNQKYCSENCRVEYLKKQKDKIHKSKNCVNCGKEFTPLKTDRQKYCTKECIIEYYKNKGYKVRPKWCKNCGKEFIPKIHLTAYCSHECREEYQNKRKHYDKLFCINCGKEFTPKSCRNIYYCSKECRKLSIEKGYLLLYERDNFKCIYCGKSSIEDGIKLSLDHIYPSSKGGKDIAMNLVTSCIICNSHKRDKIFNDDDLNRTKDEVVQRNVKLNIDNEQIIKLYNDKTASDK